MQYPALVALVAFNITLTPFFVGRNGQLSIYLNQSYFPEKIYVDFGNGRICDSSFELAPFRFQAFRNGSSVISIGHSFQTAGSHMVYVNVSYSGEHQEKRTAINVLVPISGVVLELLSPGVVALFDDVLVKCTVATGSDLEFDWDFGDGTDGLHTMMNSTRNTSLATHSYGVADSYNISVVVYNVHESVAAYLDVSVQAVEPIEKLRLRPRSELNAAALTQQLHDNECLDHSTDVVVFEAWVWKGSDVEFVFDFGDGYTNRVTAELNVWSLPFATASHSYCEEGEYQVSVIASNPLGVLNQTLQHQFYVGYQPEHLALDKHFYIIQSSQSLALQASVSRGTDVSYSWMLGDNQLDESGETLFLQDLRTGIYAISVEAYNKITDLAYVSVKRPKVFSKIFVQEQLQEILLCVDHLGEDYCGVNLDLPYEGDTHFVAQVLPPDEMSLRFTWQLSAQDIRRTSKPHLQHRFTNPGRYQINVTVQNYISSVTSQLFSLHLIEKIANLTSIYCTGPNLVNRTLTFRALYWFGTELTFQWDFGDGSPTINTSSSSLQHAYSQVGEYWISVNVWNKYSHANFLTNMFFLHQVCQKPEINILHEKEEIFSCDEDILIEAEITTNCQSSHSKYSWIIKSSQDKTRITSFQSLDLMQQPYLIVPKFSLPQGKYDIHFKVEMSSSIVYAESVMTLEVGSPKVVASLDGGYIRWMGRNDTNNITTTLTNVENETNVNYSWSCHPFLRHYSSCFQGPSPQAFLSNIFDSFELSARDVNPNLTAVQINVTIGIGDQQLEMSQVIEFVNVPHTVTVEVDCLNCADHGVNHNSKVILKASCKDCFSESVDYEWKVWKIEEGRHWTHFSNYQCVQADGSTFYIMAPNSTEDLLTTNTSYVPNIFSSALDEIHRDSSDEFSGDDVPPFPDLPGFPGHKKLVQNMQDFRQVRHIRDANDEIEMDPLDYDVLQHYPFEGDATYDTNSSLLNTSYPDFLPMYDNELGNLDYPEPEEGLPGESGSAVARDQSAHHFKVYLNEEEGDILEGAGPPRVESQPVFPQDTFAGDPVRHPIPDYKPMPLHLVNKPRNPIVLNGNSTSTGVHSQYLVLNPGTLQVGVSYFAHVRIKDKDKGLTGSAIELLQVSTGPINGRCTLMPAQGFSLNFYFRLHCLEWKSDHTPLHYELRYSLTQENPGHLVYFGMNRNVKFVLPSGHPTDSYKVYLNLIIHDNKGASTTVCSINRQVEPLAMNGTLIHYVYNETFHPKSQLSKYLRDRQTQLLLHEIHVLTSAVNSHVLNKGRSVQEKSLIEQIRFRFMELIEGLKIFRKIEMVQALSSMNQIISDSTELNTFELQKVFNIYQKYRHLKGKVHGFGSDEVQQETLALLAQLTYTSHSVRLRNEELIRIGREAYTFEVQAVMKTRLYAEEPLLLQVPHATTRALYISKENSKTFERVSLTNSRVQIPPHILNLTSLAMQNKVKRCSNEYCSPTESCALFIIHEFDYVSMPRHLKYASDFSQNQTSVLVNVLTCEEPQIITIPSYTSFEVTFARSTDFNVRNSSFLDTDHVNIHQVNISADDVFHSLLFHVEFRKMHDSFASDFYIETFFGFENWPTPYNHIWKQNFPMDKSEHSFVISQEIVQVPGRYYFSVWFLRKELHARVPSVVLDGYNAFAWKDMCLAKSRGVWGHENCSSLNSSNKKEIYCKCTSQEITGYSVFLETVFLRIPVRDLLEPYFNLLPEVVLLSSFLVYFILLTLNHRKSRLINVCTTPYCLPDNKDTHRQLYLICVKTGTFFSSGTTASVFVVIHGEKGMTETRQMIGPKSRKFSFQKGAVDFFLMSTEDNLGPLIKAEVWHNNAGSSPSWFLKELLIKDLKTGFSYQFECNKWLSAVKENGQIELELTILDERPSYIAILWETFCTCIQDFNAWNSVYCSTPASHFTSVQRISTCFCCFLNYALLFSTMADPQESDPNTKILHISQSTLSSCLLVSSIVSIPQILSTILFRFSKKPTPNRNTFWERVPFFCSWSLCYLYCWWRPKRSNSGRSTSRSDTSFEGSDSFYSSSYDDSSTFSFNDVEEDGGLSLLEERDVFPSTPSSVNLNEPVSPLQKTLSTWQAFEVWIRKKQDSMIDSSRRQHPVFPEKSDSGVSPNEIILEDMHREQESSALQLETDDPEINEESKKTTMAEVHQHLNVNHQLPFLHQFFYFGAWALTACNGIVSTALTVLNTSSFSSKQCLFWMKCIFMSVISSALLTTPCLVFVFSSIAAICKYLSYDDSKLLNSQNKNQFSEVSVRRENYNAIEYFKRYLRPPKEQVLEQFRKIAWKETKILDMLRRSWQFVSLLILLTCLIFPENTMNHYLQRTSIHKSFFRSKEMLASSITNPSKLYDWLETDFISAIYGDHQCLEHNFECGLTASTSCITVGRLVLRIFKQPFQDDCQTPVSITNWLSHNVLYEPRSIRGRHGSFCVEDELVAMGETKSEAEDQVDQVLLNLEKDNVTEVAISVEVLLFNQPYSYFYSVSFLFEIVSGQVFERKDIQTAKLHDAESPYYIANFVFHLVFLIVTLVSSKNHCWRSLKFGLTYWNCKWNCLSAIFNAISSVYLSAFLLSLIELKSILHKLTLTQFNTNIDISRLSRFELMCQYLLSLLMFVHIITVFRVLHFNAKLSFICKKISNAGKLTIMIGLILLFSMSLCDLLIRCFMSSNFKKSNYILRYFSITNIIFGDHHKPEFENFSNGFDKLYSILVILIIIIIHITFLTVFRAVLINSRPPLQNRKDDKITFSETKSALRRRLMPYFRKNVPSMVEKDHVYPVELLLVELEDLAERLLNKADTLFKEDQQNIEVDCVLDVPTFKPYPVIDIEEDTIDLSSCNVIDQQMSLEQLQAEVVERLISTIPSFFKTKEKVFQTASLNASMNSQRKFKYRQTGSVSLSSSMQSHKIRKTYPMFHVDTESYSSSSSEEFGGTSLRKTKSRGKGKHRELNLSMLNDDTF